MSHFDAAHILRKVFLRTEVKYRNYSKRMGRRNVVRVPLSPRG